MNSDSHSTAEPSYSIESYTGLRQSIIFRMSCLVFFRVLSQLLRGQRDLVRRLHLTRSFASSPDSSPSDKSFLTLFNHLRFGIPLLLFQRTSITISCPHILLLFSVCAHTVLHFLGYFSHLRCPSNSFKIVHWPLFLSFCPQLPTTITDAYKMAADKMFFLISKICFTSLL